MEDELGNRMEQYEGFQNNDLMPLLPTFARVDGNWNDYSNFFKRGVYIQKKSVVKPFSVEDLESLPKNHDARKNPGLCFERSEWGEVDMPIFSKVVNREDIIFEGFEPVSKKD